MNEKHEISKGLTEWSCKCGRYGVLITAQERESFDTCPAAR